MAQIFYTTAKEGPSPAGEHVEVNFDQLLTSSDVPPEVSSNNPVFTEEHVEVDFDQLLTSSHVLKPPDVPKNNLSSVREHVEVDFDVLLTSPDVLKPPEVSNNSLSPAGNHVEVDLDELLTSSDVLKTPELPNNSLSSAGDLVEVDLDQLLSPPDALKPSEVSNISLSSEGGHVEVDFDQLLTPPDVLKPCEESNNISPSSRDHVEDVDMDQLLATSDALKPPEVSNNSPPGVDSLIRKTQQLTSASDQVEVDFGQLLTPPDVLKTPEESNNSPSSAEDHVENVDMSQLLAPSDALKPPDVTNNTHSASGENVEVDMDELLTPSDVPKPPEVSDNSILVEDGDTFQCGKCFHQFSFVDFIVHKKNICQGAVKLSDDGAEEMLTEPIPLPESEVTPPVTEDNNNEDVLVDFNGDLVTFKVAENAKETVAMLAEEMDEFETAPVKDDDPMQLSPIIGNNIMLSHDVKDATNGAFLEERVVNAENLNIPVISIPEQVAYMSDSSDSGSESGGSEKEDPESKIVRLYCIVCDKEFRKNFDLQQHLRSHTGERPFQCVVCGRAFAQKSNVSKHMATHKVWPKRSNSVSPAPMIPGKNEQLLIQKMFVCNYCPSVFESYCDLKSHRVIHLDEKVFKCIQKSCTQTFKELDEFLEHTQTHDISFYECHICHKEYTSLDDLGQHQLFHEAVKKVPREVPCPHCKAKFKSKESLDKHLATDIHNYRCKNCDKVFSSERFLRRHIASHLPSNKWLCPVCQKPFRTEHYLNMHTIIHTDYKPFVCQTCGAAFNRKDKLSRHNLTHENAKRFKCPYTDICNKEFNRKDKLKKHVSIHTTPPPDWRIFRCQYCAKAFSTQSLVDNHEFLCGATIKKQIKNVELNPPPPEEEPELEKPDETVGDTGLSCEEIIRKALEPTEVVLKVSNPDDY